jgi:hypothetical protein
VHGAAHTEAAVGLAVGAFFLPADHALGAVDAADRADAANLGIERRLVRVGRVMLERVPEISPEELRTALHDACEPNDLRHKSDELLDRVVDRVLGNPSLNSASGPAAGLDSN